MSKRPRECQTSAGPESNTNTVDKRVVPHKGSGVRPWGKATSFVCGSGSRVQDNAGSQYLDCLSHDVILGHGNAKVMEVLNQQTYISSNVGLVHKNCAELGRRLTSLLPGSLNTCFFVHSQSEANDLAISLGMCATNSDEVIAIDQADHGISNFFLKVAKERSQPLTNCSKRVHLIDLPDASRGKFREANFPAEDVGWMYSSDVETLINRLRGENRRLGVFISETIICHGNGYVQLPPRYLREVYSRIHANGGVVIADETFSGLGRTGKFLWGFQYHDVVPDIVTVGKALGNGYPVAAVVTTREIAKKFVTVVNGFSDGNRFSGDPLGCAVAIAVLDQLGDAMRNGSNVAQFLLDKMTQLEEIFSFVHNVRGIGLAIAIDLQLNDLRSQPLPEHHANLAQSVSNKLMERGIIVDLSGPTKNVIGFAPSLLTTMAEANDIVMRLTEVLNEVEEILHVPKRWREEVKNVGTKK